MKVGFSFEGNDGVFACVLSPINLSMTSSIPICGSISESGGIIVYRYNGGRRRSVEYCYNGGTGEKLMKAC